DQQLEAEGQRGVILDGEDRRAQPTLHIAKGIPELSFVSDCETNATGVALVRGSESLEHDRISDRRCCRDRGVLRFGPSSLSERNPTFGQELPGAEVVGRDGRRRAARGWKGRHSKRRV